MAEDNPFADPEGINPFADPSVTAATSAQPGVEDYNPFADEGTKEKEPEPVRAPPPTKTDKKSKEKKKSKERPPAPSRPKESEPAIMQPDQDLPPTYTPAPANFQQDDELKKREEEIARREAALSERERNIERLGVTERPNNFPPFPKFCPSPFKPCFYINIKVEVPPTEQWKVYVLLGLLIYTWVLLILNTIVTIIGAVIDTSQLTTMGVSILYLVLFAPASLFCWFLPTYYAYKKDSSLAFMWVFFVLFFQGLGYALNAIGIPQLGAAGYFNGASFFSSDNRSEQRNAAGAMYIIMGFLWLVGIPVLILVIIMIHRYYRSSGHTINSAMEEGVSGAAKNKYVRGAVKSGVKAGVSTAYDAGTK